MEELVEQGEVTDQLQWKKRFTKCNGIGSWPAPIEEVVDQLKWKK